MYAPWYCSHSTQTQYHCEQSDTVIAQKGPLIAQTPDTIKTMGFIFTVATQAHMYKYSTVMGFKMQIPI